jgi:hypothetical protein
MNHDDSSAETDRQHRPPSAQVDGGLRQIALPLAAICSTAALFILVLSTRRLFDGIVKMHLDFGWCLPGVVRMLPASFVLWLVGVLFGVTFLLQLVLKNRSIKAACNIVAVAFASLLGALYLFGMLWPLLAS